MENSSTFTAPGSGESLLAPSPVIVVIRQVYDVRCVVRFQLDQQQADPRQGPRLDPDEHRRCGPGDRQNDRHFQGVRHLRGHQENGRVR